jgi:phosphosulfolactate synthase (CoM biosynthesis protein A)
LTPQERTLLRQLRDGDGPAANFGLLGSTRMKKIVLVAAAAGLLSLTACGSNTPAENAADAQADNLEMMADNMEDMADNATTEASEAALENQADNLHEAADNVEDAGVANAM